MLHLEKEIRMRAGGIDGQKKRGGKRKAGGREGRKENERGREINLPNVKQTVILVLTKET